MSDSEVEKTNNLNLTLVNSIDNESIVTQLNKISQFQTLVQGTLKSGHDYDTIPGTNKPTLLKPGAEKIGMLFGLNPEYEFLSNIEDYKAEFFAYTIKCTLYKNGQAVAQGVGSCNSKESKYRYLNVDEKDVPAHLDKTTLKTKKDKYGRIKYQIENADVCSLVNTILKMAKKRAYIDATLQVAALSEIFTQDVEDMKEFIQNEQAENMTVEEAAAIKVSFGKHKGKSLGEVYKTAPDWIEWFLTKADKKDPVIEKAISIMLKAVEDKKKSKVMENQGPDDFEIPVDTETGEVDLSELPECLR